MRIEEIILEERQETYSALNKIWLQWPSIVGKLKQEATTYYLNYGAGFMFRLF
jgi:hypothetical protein